MISNWLRQSDPWGALPRRDWPMVFQAAIEAVKRRVSWITARPCTLRAEARDAMIAAMDVVGNPSSVHAEGRAAKALVERARAQVATAFGADGADIVFVSGATEAAALACAGRGLFGSEVEHDAVRAWIDPVLAVDEAGQVAVTEPARSAVQLANSESAAR